MVKVEGRTMRRVLLLSFPVSLLARSPPYSKPGLKRAETSRKEEQKRGEKEQNEQKVVNISSPT